MMMLKNEKAIIYIKIHLNLIRKIEDQMYLTFIFCILQKKSNVVHVQSCWNTNSYY